jgi:hypothetical protein
VGEQDLGLGAESLGTVKLPGAFVTGRGRLSIGDLGANNRFHLCLAEAAPLDLGRPNTRDRTGERRLRVPRSTEVRALGPRGRGLRPGRRRGDRWCLVRWSPVRWAPVRRVLVRWSPVRWDLVRWVPSHWWCVGWVDGSGVVDCRQG